MYGNEFLSCIKHQAPQLLDNIFRLDLEDYIDTATLELKLFNQVNLNIKEFCTKLGSIRNTTLLIDNIYEQDIDQGSIQGALYINNILREVAPETNVIFRSKFILKSAPWAPILIQPMNEADMNKYILSNSEFNVPESIISSGEIYRLSGGRPGNVERIISKMEHARFSELVNSTSATALQNIDNSTIPTSIKIKIDSIRTEHSDSLYQLLLCLAIFPYGEDISHIRYFDRTKPFYTKHSIELSRKGLIEVSRYTYYGELEVEAPKIVWEINQSQNYVQSLLTEERFKDFTEKALTTYFGNWKIKKYKLGSSFSHKVLTEYDYSFNNATSLLRRYFNDAIAENTPQTISSALDLINFYTSRLDKICNFRNICNFCHTIMDHLIRFSHIRASQDILFRYANSMRMLNSFEEALVVYNLLESLENQTKQRLASVWLNISMLYDETDRKPEAIKFARQASNLSDKNATYFHAQSILTVLDSKDNKAPRLERIKGRCMRDDHHVTANNISLRLAAKFQKPEVRIETYRQMAETAIGKGDQFNYVKATINYLEIAHKAKHKIHKNQLNHLLTCYQYVASQRLINLFTRSHSLLWKHYLYQNDIKWLGRIFCYSSPIFRLANLDQSERQYLSELMGLGVLDSTALEETERYYIQRRAFEI